MRFKVFYLLFIFILFLFFELALCTGEKIPWWSINGGGTIYSSAGDKKLCGSVAQSMAGRDTSATQKSYAGFWNPWVVDATTDVEEEAGEPIFPEEFSISQNYPNPFNPHTVIEYSLPERCQVTIVVYNILGQRLRVLKDEVEEAGYKRVTWDGKEESGSEVASGIYFYRIQAKDFVMHKKMLLLK